MNHVILAAVFGFSGGMAAYLALGGERPLLMFFALIPIAIVASLAGDAIGRFFERRYFQ